MSTGEAGTLDSRKARVVELKIFGGLNHGEIAEVIETSTVTVRRDWSLPSMAIHGIARTPGDHFFRCPESRHDANVRMTKQIRINVNDRSDSLKKVKWLEDRSDFNVVTIN